LPCRKTRVGRVSGSPGDAKVAASSTGSSRLPVYRNSRTIGAAASSAAIRFSRVVVVGPSPTADTSRSASRLAANHEAATKSAPAADATKRGTDHGFRLR
jgi:hypothetical protein